ncbi:hypothetical protein N825_03465 [Skermanella stibiiresistens SB22]|uniref:Uncharacterized protein n=1 Tax=Skermanella stibiiresistens SB22 TaxID=1385369 RepID=W9H5J2_9PROT|nr:hypothetical protein [Skermanella stibiiresistens]EWY40051.1 hypothetical protein N825_03465 [Skermanella stibiiresistens SB22]
MTIEDLQARLRDAHARIGFEGRFAFTIGQQSNAGCYVTHWFRPTPHAFEDCKSVGVGTVADCVAALDRYVQAYPRPMTNEEVGMTLGVIPPHEERYQVAAE